MTQIYLGTVRYGQAEIHEQSNAGGTIVHIDHTILAASAAIACFDASYGGKIVWQGGNSQIAIGMGVSAGVGLLRARESGVIWLPADVVWSGQMPCPPYVLSRYGRIATFGTAIPATGAPVNDGTGIFN